MEFFCITCKSKPVLHSGEQEWLERRHVFYMTCKSNPVLLSGEQGWLEGCHGVLLHLLQEQSGSPLR